MAIYGDFVGFKMVEMKLNGTYDMIQRDLANQKTMLPTGYVT